MVKTRGTLIIAMFHVAPSPHSELCKQCRQVAYIALHYRNSLATGTLVYFIHRVRQITIYAWRRHDVAWWRYQMETFSVLLAFVRGIHRSAVNSPHKGQWRGASMFSLNRVWTNGWVKNREAGGLKRYRAHYYVTVMELVFCIWNPVVVGEFH